MQKITFKYNLGNLICVYYRDKYAISEYYSVQILGIVSNAHLK
jgi:hypothetical protein